MLTDSLIAPTDYLLKVVVEESIDDVNFVPSRPYNNMAEFDCPPLTLFTSQRFATVTSASVCDAT
jgi:hypothetical protein